MTSSNVITVSLGDRMFSPAHNRHASEMLFLEISRLLELLCLYDADYSVSYKYKLQRRNLWANYLVVIGSDAYTNYENLHELVTETDNPAEAYDDLLALQRDVSIAVHRARVAYQNKRDGDNVYHDDNVADKFRYGLRKGD